MLRLYAHLLGFSSEFLWSPVVRLKSRLVSLWLSVRLRGRNSCRRRPTLGNMPVRRDFNRTAKQKQSGCSRQPDC